MKWNETKFIARVKVAIFFEEHRVLFITRLGNRVEFRAFGRMRDLGMKTSTFSSESDGITKDAK